MPIAWALFAPPPDRTWGAQFQVAARSPAPRHDRGVARNVAADGDQQRSTSIPSSRTPGACPRLRMTYKDHPDDLAMSRFLQDRAVDIMQAAGAQEVWKGPVVESVDGSPHLLGTARMGNDPKNLGRRQVSPHARHAEPVRLRRLELRDLGARPADHDDPGTRVPGRGPHRAVCAGAARSDALRRAHALEPPGDDRLGFAHDALDELLAARHVTDESCDHAA